MLGTGLGLADEILLEAGHFGAPKHGRKRPAPQIPQKILPFPARGAAGRGKKALAGQRFALVHPGAARKRLAAQVHQGKTAVRLHGHGAVEQKVAVLFFINAALGVQKARVARKALAFGKALAQFGQHVLFRAGKPRGAFLFHRGEIGVAQRPAPALHLHGEGLKIDVLQKRAPLHAELGVAGNDGAFQLEQNDGNGLVHARGAPQIFLRIFTAGLRARQKARHVAVGVRLLGKQRKGPQADAIAVLQRFEVVVGQRCANDAGHAHLAARGRAHPLHVVVAPLHVHRVVGNQLV